MGRQFLIWFVLAGLGGVALWLAGSLWQYGGLPPSLARVLSTKTATPGVEMPAVHGGVPALRRGDALPADYALPDVHGQPQALAQWRGKRVLLNFWATWCIPCRKEMPALVAAQKAYGTASVRIIGIAMDDPLAVRTYLRHAPLNYPVLLGSVAKQDPTQLFGDGAGALPFSVLINADGTIADTRLGAMDEAQLRQWLH